MNKKGWIKIVEAFVAILLIVGVLLIVIDRGDVGKKDISSQIYDIEVAILREIQLNDALRNEILSVTPPIELTEENVAQTWNKINNRIPSYLDCKAKICEMEQICELEEYPEKNIYVQTVLITTTLDIEEIKYRQLKLFCWLI
jgi:hypothetical protein